MRPEAFFRLPEEGRGPVPLRAPERKRDREKGICYKSVIKNTEMLRKNEKTLDFCNGFSVK